MSKTGYIYSITPIKGGDDGDIYYGSTINITKRYNQHKTNFNNSINKYYSYFIFDKYGVDNCQINIVEEIKYINKSELLYRERYYIENNNCLNKTRPITSIDEKKNENLIYNKKYREEHKEDIKEKHKEYYENNKEQIAEKHKKYYEENKEELLKKSKEWKDNNKERTSESFKKWQEDHKEERTEYKKEWAKNNKEKINVQIECDKCGCLTNKKNIKRHQQTEKCKNNKV